MKKLLFLILSVFIVSVCVGCENAKVIQMKETGQIIEKYQKQETVSGDCTSILIGNIIMPSCDSDRIENRYYVKIKAHDIVQTIDNEKLFKSDKREVSVTYVKKIDVKSKRVYEEYLEINE